MRPPVQIVITPHLSMNALYYGLGEPAIYVASDLVQRLDEEEFKAFVWHERAHRELYHVEINIALTLYYCAWSLILAWQQHDWIMGPLVGAVYFFAMRALHGVIRVCQEIQADAYRHHPRLVDVFRKIRPTMGSPWGRAVLDLRIKMAGTWARR